MTTRGIRFGCVVWICGTLAACTNETAQDGARAGAAGGDAAIGPASRPHALAARKGHEYPCADPHIDGDGDRTPDCGDACPLDPHKTSPGVCGCDFSDADDDGDGSAACEDECPADPTKVVAGDCGCADAPAPAGTSCGDGLCAENSACDGAGACGDPKECTPPDSHCRHALHAGAHYYFCDRDRKPDDARKRCRHAGMDLVAIESASEDRFITEQLPLFDRAQIGATDAAEEGEFVWLATGAKFWSGGEHGESVSSAYTNWELHRPGGDRHDAKDCVVKSAHIGKGKWQTFPCKTGGPYVCEQPDECPADPFKRKLGQCGCGVTDTNRDLDGTADCIDRCPDDPDKVEPGITGCGQDDTDTDDDKVPDAIDECPLDATDTRDAQCGCPSNPRPEGTRCTEGPCGGTSTCDGNGQCTYNPSCLPEPDCVPVDVGLGVYFVCPGAGTPGDPATFADADASCGGDGTRQLARIDDDRENAIATMLLAIAGTGPAWIGGNDRGADGTWRWRTSSGSDGNQFWSGGADGSSTGSLYANWAPAEPGGGDGEDCAALAPSGQWQDQSCGLSLPYLCESTGGHRDDGVPQPESASFCDVIPGLCGPDGEMEQPTNAATCVPQSEAFGGIECLPGEQLACEAEAFAQIDACYQCTASEEACRPLCTGIAEPPPPGATCTSLFTAADLRSCDVGAFQMAGPDRVPCAMDPDPAVADAPCDTAGGFLCMHVYDCGGSDEVCDVRDPADPELCINRCVGQNFCARPADNCADVAANLDLDCLNVEVCQDVATAYGPIDPYADPDSDLGPEPFVPTSFPPLPERPASEPYADDGERTRDKCATPGSCGESHSYCHYQVDETLNPADEATQKNGNADGGDLVEFNFEPNLSVGYRAVPGPLGLATPELTASASLLASARFDLLVASARVDIVDARAALNAKRCRVTAGAHFRVFGQDVVDLPVEEFDTNARPEFPTEAECEEVYTEFQTAVDRAKKAFRDAQALVDQYRAVQQNPGQFIVSTLCQQIAADPPRGFPAGLPNCQESPRRTINRFIEFYNLNELPELRRAASEVAAGVIGADPIPIAVVENFETEESELIVEAIFALGPIPMNLEVEAVVSYGIDVRATLDFSAGEALVAAVTGATGRQDLFSATMTGTPQAGASVRLFVGAGFSIDGFGAKAGVEGQISLGTITAPTHATVGIGWLAQPDPRTVPADILAVATGLDAIPRNEYRFMARYQVGSQVGISDLLRGSLAAKVKIEFLFFSKTWRKVLLWFEGFCPADAEGNPPEACMRDLITSQGNPEFADWGLVRMPFPFLELAPIPVEDEIISGTIPVSPAAPVAAEVEELFYDSQCTCVERADLLPPGEEPEDCFRKADCCDPSAATICFDETADDDPLKYCLACRDELDTCRSDVDCCPGLQPEAGALGCYVKPSENPFDNPNPIGHCRGCLAVGEECAPVAEGEPDPCCLPEISCAPNDVSGATWSCQNLSPE